MTALCQIIRLSVSVSSGWKLHMSSTYCNIPRSEPALMEPHQHLWPLGTARSVRRPCPHLCSTQYPPHTNQFLSVRPPTSPVCEPAAVVDSPRGERRCCLFSHNRSLTIQEEEGGEIVASPGRVTCSQGSQFHLTPPADSMLMQHSRAAPCPGSLPCSDY